MKNWWKGITNKSSNDDEKKEISQKFLKKEMDEVKEFENMVEYMSLDGKGGEVDEKN